MFAGWSQLQFILEEVPSGFKKPVVLFKTGTVTKKNYFCIFRFRSLKYKKPDPVYHLGPDRKREKIPKTGGYRTGSETLATTPQGSGIILCSHGEMFHGELKPAALF